MRLRTEFATVTRTGRKARCGSVVVYRLEVRHQFPVEQVSRGGVIVGRNVGDSVTRHRVSRLIRAELAQQLPQGHDELIVVRALPDAGRIPAQTFRRNIGTALERLRARQAVGRAQVRAGLGQEPGTDPVVSP